MLDAIGVVVGRMVTGRTEPGKRRRCHTCRVLEEEWACDCLAEWGGVLESKTFTTLRHLLAESSDDALLRLESGRGAMSLL